VSLAWWEGGQTDVAVKSNGVDCADSAAIDNERQLLEVLLSKPHKNVVTVYGICTDAPDGGVRLVMDYCACGSLDSMLRSQVWRLVWCLLLCVWIDVAHDTYVRTHHPLRRCLMPRW
jgi:hypothetical protein